MYLDTSKKAAHYNEMAGLQPLEIGLTLSMNIAEYRALTYVMRYKLKGNPHVDLEKAISCITGYLCYLVERNWRTTLLYYIRLLLIPGVDISPKKVTDENPHLDNPLEVHTVQNLVLRRCRIRTKIELLTDSLGYLEQLKKEL